MFKDLKTRAAIKRYLIFLNIALGFILFVLTVYWLASVRPQQIAMASAQKQYGYYSLDNLPFNTGEIKNNYFGKSKLAKHEEISHELDDKELDVSSMNEEQLLAESEKILAKTNKLLTQTKTEQTDLIDEEISTIEPLKAVLKTHDKQPKIALIITNLGLNRRSTELALTLPSQCALGFLPYTKTLKPLLQQAHNKGHEVYLYLPMQTDKSYDNPGKYTLLTNLATEENAIRLSIILNAHAKYEGVYSNYKEIFTDNIQRSSAIFDQIDDKNLIFILGKGRTSKVEPHFKEHHNIIPTNLVLDEEPDEESVKIKLEALANLAEKNGVALGYSQGFNITIEMLRDWIPSLAERGIVIVPISALVKGV